MKTLYPQNHKAAMGAVVVCLTLIESHCFGPCMAQTPPPPLAADASQPPPADLPVGLADVVKLTRAGISEEVILNKIRNDGVTYNLSADQIIYLSNQGVSQNVLSALLPNNAAPQASPPPAATEAPTPTPPSYAEPAPAPPAGPEAQAVVPAEQPVAPPTPTLGYFQSQLTPYGAWVDVPPYGICWQPAVNFGWRPYYDGGHWEYTDAGWYWQSEYPWGDIAFHYGRWAYTPSGWIWIPAYQYAPAWVFWRHADADGCLGWAPLPFGAVFVGGGWVFNGVRVGLEFDFGLGVDFFTFVDCGHFWDHDFRRFVVPRDRLGAVFHRSVIESRYAFDHGRFINEGLPRERMALLTHRNVADIAVRKVVDVRHQEEQRNVVARRDDIRGFKSGVTRPNAIRAAEPRREVGGANNRGAQVRSPEVRPQQPNQRNDFRTENRPGTENGAQQGNRPSAPAANRVNDLLRGNQSAPPERNNSMQSGGRGAMNERPTVNERPATPERPAVNERQMERPSAPAMRPSSEPPGGGRNAGNPSSSSSSSPRGDQKSDKNGNH